MIEKLFARLDEITLSRKRTLTFILGLYILISCDSEDSADCLQLDGDDVSYTVEVPTFDKLQVEDEILLRIKDGPVQNVFIQTGKNIAPEIYIAVVDGTLIMRDDNSCNLFREYGKTTITVTAPNITFIKQASSNPIRSIGVLTYPELLIWSNTFPTPLLTDANKSGDVFLDLNVQSIAIQANGSSNFVLSGVASTANFNFSDEYPQMDARNLLVNDITIKHVSAGRMIVHPIDRLSGQIRATGDVIAVNRPAEVAVEEFFTGRLIFDDLD